MARIRTIKPEFWTSAQITECSVIARLLFIGLWNFADDAGRLSDSPRTIKMQILPGEDLTADDVHGLLNELSVNGLILRYDVGGKGYIQVTGWHHQRINRPNPSKIPGPEQATHGVVTEQSCKKTPEGKGKEGSSVDKSTGANAPSISDQDRLWREGVPWLASRTGKPPDKVRPIIGKWAKAHGARRVLDAIAFAQAKEAIDPVPFITATLGDKARDDGAFQLRPLGVGG